MTTPWAVADTCAVFRRVFPVGNENTRSNVPVLFNQYGSGRPSGAEETPRSACIGYPRRGRDPCLTFKHRSKPIQIGCAHMDGLKLLFTFPVQRPLLSQFGVVAGQTFPYEDAEVAVQTASCGRRMALVGHNETTLWAGRCDQTTSVPITSLVRGIGRSFQRRKYGQKLPDHLKQIAGIRESRPATPIATSGYWGGRRPACASVR